MRANLNILFVLTLGTLCGQSLGFWPFDFVAAYHDRQQPLFTDNPDSGVKRVAIIGEFRLILDIYNVLFFTVP
jgi:hypothetical protein